MWMAFQMNHRPKLLPIFKPHLYYYYYLQPPLTTTIEILFEIIAEIVLVVLLGDFTVVKLIYGQLDFCFDIETVLNKVNLSNCN